MAIFISFVIVAFVLLFYFAITAELLLKWRSMLERCEMEVFAAIRECSSLVDEERRALFEAICCCKDAQVAVEDIVETYSYGLLGFIANYKESLNIIREMNEDAPIVVVGAMNIEEGIHFIMDGKTINFGELYGTIVDAGNTWLAGYVADMDNVYYSETEDLSLIVDEIANKKWNSNMLSLMSADFAWNSDRGGDTCR